MIEVSLEELEYVFKNSLKIDFKTSYLFQNSEGILETIQSDMSLQPFVNQILTEAEHAMQDPIPQLLFSDFMRYYHTGDRKQYDTLYSAKRKRLNALALCLVSGIVRENQKTDYLHALEDTIWSICDEVSWCIPAHFFNEKQFLNDMHYIEKQVDMTACETSFALTEIVHLLRDDLSPLIIHRVNKEVYQRVLCPFFSSEQPWYWESWTNNWPAVCAASLGMTVLYLEEDPQKLARMIHRLLRSFVSYLTGFSNDGGCREGLAYWRYGFGYFVYFADALKQRTGNQIDLLNIELVHRIAQFPAFMQFSNGKTFNFSDSLEDLQLHTGLLSKIQEQIPQVTYPFVHRLSDFTDDGIRWGNCSRNFFWSKKCILNRDPSHRGSDEISNHYFPDIQIAVTRAVTANNQLIALATKGGHNNEPHNHNDLGHFVIHAAGKNILADLGMGEYHKNYFSNDRYDSIFTSSKGHSVPIINGYYQKSGQQRNSKTTYYKTDAIHHMEIGFDVTSAYDDPGLEKFERHFTWRSSPQKGQVKINLQDHFIFQEVGAHVTEVFVSTCRPQIIKDGIVEWNDGGVSMTFEASQTKTTIEPVHTSNRNGYLTVYVLLVTHMYSTKEGEANFEFVCYG